MTMGQADSTVRPTLRPAREDDVDEIARVWLLAWHDGHDGHVPAELAAQRTAEAFPARAREALPSAWVAERDGEVLGFVTAVGDEVKQLFVDRPARGTGVAADLLRKGAELVAAAGHDVAWLAVVTGNARARAFYEREGWRDSGPLDYQADTAAGPVAVPTHRYERDVRELRDGVQG